MGIGQFLDTEFLLPHTPSINIVCNSPCAPLVQSSRYMHLRNLFFYARRPKVAHCATPAAQQGQWAIKFFIRTSDIRHSF